MRKKNPQNSLRPRKIRLLQNPKLLLPLRLRQKRKAGFRSTQLWTPVFFPSVADPDVLRVVLTGAVFLRLVLPDKLVSCWRFQHLYCASLCLLCSVVVCCSINIIRMASVRDVLVFLCVIVGRPVRSISVCRLSSRAHRRVRIRIHCVCANGYLHQVSITEYNSLSQRRICAHLVRGCRS